jgi:hypothetical protein
VWTVNHVDEALLLMFGKPAGARECGKYPSDSVNQRVEARLLALHQASLAHARAAFGGER